MSLHYLAKLLYSKIVNYIARKQVPLVLFVYFR